MIHRAWGDFPTGNSWPCKNCGGTVVDDTMDGPSHVCPPKPKLPKARIVDRKRRWRWFSETRV